MFNKILIVPIVAVAFAILAFTVDGTKKKSVDKEISLESDTTYAPIVVLELFTSQGCSSCPAADLLLEKVKRENPENLFALSYHVDYWNYIGWQDPFSNPLYSQKQNVYNVKFRYRSNYTPEVVVNGREHFVGSDASKMQSVISRYSKEEATNSVQVFNGKVDESVLHFDYNIDGSVTNKNIRTVLVLDERTTKVKRGENRNRTIKNSNIVVAEHTHALTNTKGSLSIRIPEIVSSGEKLFLMVFIENAQKDITAAAKWSFEG